MTVYPLKVEDETWKEYKQTVSKDITINDDLNSLIKEKIKKHKQKGDG